MCSDSVCRDSRAALTIIQDRVKHGSQLDHWSWFRKGSPLCVNLHHLSDPVTLEVWGPAGRKRSRELFLSVELSKLLIVDSTLRCANPGMVPHWSLVFPRQAPQLMYGQRRLNCLGTELVVIRLFIDLGRSNCRLNIIRLYHQIFQNLPNTTSL